MGDHHRTIRVNRGVRYNWRESLESILEDGELSKFTVKPSGTLHLYVTRPKKNKPRTNKTRRKKKLCTITSWMHLARNMLSPRSHRCSAAKEQCIQTDCTIPVCYDIDVTEELCLCDARPSLPSAHSPEPKNGYFQGSNRQPFKDPAEPTFELRRNTFLQRDIAVPKTKPRSLQRKPQPRQESPPPEPPPHQSGSNSPSGSSSSLPRGNRSSGRPSRESFPPKFSKERSPKPRPSKDSIPRTSSASSRRKTMIPNETPSSKRKSHSPQLSSKMSSLSPRSSKTVEGQRKSGLAPEEKTELSQSTKPKRSKSPAQAENPLKPTIGLARLTSLNESLPQRDYHSTSTSDYERRKVSSKKDSWDSHVADRLHRLHQSEEYKLYINSQYPTPRLDERHLERSHKLSSQRNLRGTLWKVYSSHNYLEPTYQRNMPESDNEGRLGLRRKNGSYMLPTPEMHQRASMKFDNARELQLHNYPSELTHWPSPKYNKHKHNVYQQIDTKWDHEIRSIGADRLRTNYSFLAPNRLRKVYSYYEIVSDPSFTEMTAHVNPVNKNITTPEMYPAAVASRPSVENSSDDVRDFLIQIKNVLSRYFNENIKGKKKIDGEYFKLGKLNGKKLKEEKKNKDTPREKKKLQQEKTLRPERKKSPKLMGLRYCY